MDHVVRLDANARIESVRTNAFCDWPMFAAFDFRAAFSSVSHLWIQLCFVFHAFPCGVRVLLRSMFENLFAYIVSGGSLELAFVIQSGVLTGCPLAGMICVLVVDPFLRYLTRQIGLSRGISYGMCADDAGAVLRTIGELRTLCFFVFAQNSPASA